MTRTLSLVAVLLTSCSASHPLETQRDALAAESGTVEAEEDAPVAAPPQCQPRIQSGLPRSLYVSRSHQIVVDELEQARLFEFVRGQRITGLTLYDLGTLLQDVAGGEAALVQFIVRAREQGVIHLSAPIGYERELALITSFCQAHPEAAFDEFITEIEYWHNCDQLPSEDVVRPCFEDFRGMLIAMRSQAQRLRAEGGRSIHIGAYLGWSTRPEAREVAALVDRVVLHYERASPALAYHFSAGRYGSLRGRLSDFSGRAEVWPLFYARGEAPMNAYLADHGLDAAEADWERELEAESEAWACDVTVGGFMYFDYRSLAEALATP